MNILQKGISKLNKKVNPQEYPIGELIVIQKELSSHKIRSMIAVDEFSVRDIGFVQNELMHGLMEEMRPLVQFSKVANKDKLITNFIAEITVVERADNR